MGSRAFQHHPRAHARPNLHERMSTHVQAIYPFEERLIPGHEYSVISLHPIWAWAVVFGGKDVENRTWAAEPRGRVLIHASVHKASLASEQDMRAELSFLTGIPRAELPVTFLRGAILGSVEIVDCVRDAPSKWAVPEHNHWLLREPRKLGSPVLGVKGKLQFWRWRCRDRTFGRMPKGATT